MSISGFRSPHNNSFFLAIASGQLTDITSVHKFGYNPDIDTTSDPETIWAQGGEYSFSSSAETWYLMSTSASDVAVQITVEGLDSSWNEVSQTVTLTGQTPVALTTPLIRVNHAYNSSGTDQVGTVYLSRSNSATAGVPNTATDIRAHLLPEHQNSAIAIYSIPAGYTGYLLHLNMQASTAIVDFLLRTREFGGVFRIRSRTLVGDTGPVVVDWESYLELAEKTDIEVRVNSVGNNNTTVSCHFDLILVRQ